MANIIPNDDFFGQIAGYRGLCSVKGVESRNAEVKLELGRTTKI